MKYEFLRTTRGITALMAVLCACGMSGCDDSTSATAGTNPCSSKECAGDSQCIVQNGEAVCACGAEQTVCEEGQVCSNGQCTAAPTDTCAGVNCSGDAVCKDGKCTCGEEICSDNQTCTGGKCENLPSDGPCDGITCSGDAVCQDGKCICGEEICEGNQTCKGGKCEEAANPCEGISCSGDAVCQDGKCICGEEICEGNQTCEGGTCKAQTESCDEVCTGDAVCIDGACKCGESICENGLSCVQGECLCGTSKCEENEFCDKGSCSIIPEDPCADKTCDPSDTCLVIANEAKCVSPLCIEDGAEKTCENGEICHQGTCMDPKCVGITCGEESKCGVIDGTAGCLCGETICEAGKTCVSGECKSPCDLVECGEGEMCVDGVCSCDGNGLKCAVDEKCKDNKECVKGNSCSSECTDGLTCIDGECVCAAEGTTCADYEVCQNDVCKDKACLDKTCTGEGQICDRGNCIPAACKGVTCESGMACQTDGRCVFEKCVDKVCDEGKTCDETGTCRFNEAPKLTLLGDTVTDESGVSVRLSTHLDKKPTANVVIAISISNPDEAVVDLAPAEVTLNPGNYFDGESFNVSGIRDYVIDGDKEFTVNLSTTSDDPDFNGLKASLKMVNRDVDLAQLIIDPTSGTTDESGTKAIFKAKLAAKPTADVEIALSSSNTAEGTVSPDKLVFSPENALNEQTITMTGVDDSVQDGNQIYQLIIGDALSSDPNFNGMKTAAIELINADDDKAGIATDLSSFMGKEGTEGTIGIKLMTKPAGDVTIKATTSKESEAKVTTTGGVTFTSEDYNTYKYIGFDYIADDIQDGDQAWAMTLTSTSSDSNYNNISVKVPGTTVDIDKAGIDMSECAPASIIEGKTAICSIKLTSKPISDVTINIASSDTTTGVVSSKSSIVFTATDWSNPQNITITGVEDHRIDGTKTPTVTFTTTTDDANYKAITKTVTYTVTDKDKAGISITPGYTTNLSEADASIQYTMTVKLAAQPEKDVTVSAQSSDTTELKVTPSSQTITAANWDKGVNFKYQAVDDSELDNTQTANLTFRSTSTDTKFSGLAISTTNITIADNETPEITAVPSVSSMYCGGSNANMKIKLTTKPTANVTLSLSLVDSKGNTIDNVTKGITLQTKSLTFTPSNFNAPQTVNITAPVNGTQPAQAYYGMVRVKAIASGANGYNGQTFYKNLFPLKAFCDPGDFTSNSTIKLPKGKYSMLVKGAGGGSYTVSMPSARYGGKGGTASAQFELKSEQTAFIRIGGGGSTCYKENCAGSNGGSPGHYNKTTTYGCGGGGGTDIRLGTDNYAYRVIVAGGGGGAMYGALGGTSGGANGGDSSGQNGLNDGTPTTTTPGGGQNGCNTGNKTLCKFGGGNAEPSSSRAGGGGGGWFGGASGQAKDNSGAGGSNFIYGKTATGSTYTSAGGKLTDAVVVFVTDAVNERGTGAAHDTNGSAKITVIESE